MGYAARANKTAVRKREGVLTFPRCPVMSVKGRGERQMFRRCAKDVDHRGAHDFGPWQSVTPETFNSLVEEGHAR